MRLPLRRWKQTLRALGLEIVESDIKTSRRQQRTRRSPLESLEPRQMLTGSPPTIESLLVSASTVVQGSTLTLTAHNVADADDAVTSVAFYRDANHDGTLEPESDELLTTVNTGSDDWTTTLDTASFPTGSQTFFAQAIDQEALASNIVSQAATIAGLAGRWSLNDGSGSAAHDGSNNHDDGTLQDSPAWTTGPANLPGIALALNGTSQYVSLGNPNALNITGEITLSAWVKADEINGVHNIVARGYSTSPGGEVFLRIFGGRYEVGSWDGTIVYATTATVPAEDVGNWVLVTGLYDGSAWRLYRNGVELSATNATSGALPVNDGWAIGARASGSERFFQGAIADVRIYDRGLSASEAQSLYVPPATQDATLAGEWALNDGNGTTAADNTTHHDDGALQDSPTWTTGPAGQAATALALNGATQYVSLGNPAALNVTGAITLSAWVKADEIMGVHNIIARGYTLSPYGEVYLRINGGQYQVGSWDGGNYCTTASIPAEDVGQWVLLTGTYDGSAWRLYRNGVEIAATDNATGAVSVNDGWAIGARANGTERLFQGAIADARIYDGALSASAVQSLYFPPVNISQTPVGQWTLNDGSGSSAHDASVQHDDGTLQNSPSWTAGPTGQASSALTLNGTNQSVALGNPAALNITGAITLSAWVKADEIMGVHNIIARGYATSPASEVFLRIYGGRYEVGSWDGTSVFTTTATVPTEDVGHWVLITGLYDGSAWRIYRNGVEISATNAATGAVPVNDGWALGARGNSTERFFQGAIADARIYNRGLSASEAQSLYFTPASDVPVGAWVLNEGTGGTAQDSSSNHDNGTLVNNPTWAIGPTGQPHSALRLDGTSQLVSLGNPTALNITGAITLSAWVRPETTDGFQNILVRGHATSPNGEVLLRIGNGQYQVGSWDGTAHLASANVPAGDLNQWVLLTGVYDGAAWRLYRNGVELAAVNDSVGAVPVSDGWAIGARAGGTERFFQGGVSDARIYNRGLSASEVQALYQPPVAPPVVAVGQWILNDGAGSTAHDGSNNHDDGVLQNGPAWITGPANLSGTALALNGTNQYVSLGNPAALNITGAITLSAWVKADEINGVHNIIARGYATSPGGEVFLRIFGGRYEVGSWDGTNAYATTVPVPTEDIGEWVLITGLYDGTAWRLYRNGVEISAADSATGAVSVNDGWAIGARANGTERFFQGAIADVRIYDRGLSASEVATLAAPVNSNDHLPVFILPEETAVEVWEGAHYTFVAVAEDDDEPAQTISYSLIGAPAGASIDLETGVFTWNVGETNGGHTYGFAIRATDNGTPALHADLPISIQVHEINDAPVAAAHPAPLEFDEDTIRTVDLTTLFSDAEDAASALTYTVVASSDETIVPLTGLSINSSGVLSVHPAADKFGYATITVRATDTGIPGESNSAQATDLDLFVIVDPVDDAPRVVGASSRPLSLDTFHSGRPTFLNLNDFFADPEWGSYLNYTVTADNPAFFGGRFDQPWQIENGSLALYPSGLAGTTNVHITATDETQTEVERTIAYTSTALPYVWFEPSTDGFQGTSLAKITLRRSGGYLDQSLDVQVAGLTNDGSLTTFTFPANQDKFEYQVPFASDVDVIPEGGSPSVDSRTYTLTLISSVNYQSGDPTHTWTYDTTTNFTQFDYESTFNQIWLDNTSSVVDVVAGDHFDLTFKRSGNLTHGENFNLQLPLQQGSSFGVIPSYPDGGALAFGTVASFPQNSDSVTVRFTAYDGAAYQLDPPSTLLIKMQQWDQNTILSNSEVKVKITDAQTLGPEVDLWFSGAYGALEDSPGVLIGVNDGTTEGNITQDTEDVTFDRVVHQIAIERAARDNEADRGRQQHANLIYGFPAGQANGGLSVAGPPGIPGTLTWTIPDGLKVYWDDLGWQDGNQTSRWTLVPSGVPLEFQSGTSRNLNVEGISPTSGQITAHFTPHPEYTNEAPGREDSVLFHAVQVQLIGDSNRDGEIDTSTGGSDDGVEDSKRANVPINRDDDDQNRVPDFQQQSAVNGENDLVEMKVRILPENGSAAMWQALQGQVLAISSSGEANLHLWRNETKQNGALPNTFTIGTDTLPTTIWVEASIAGPGKVTASLKHSANESEGWSTDVVQTQSNEKYIVALDFNGGTQEDVPYDDHALPPSLWQSIFAQRAAWQAGWGNPTVSNQQFIDVLFPQLIQEARRLLDSDPDHVDVVGMLERLAEWEHDETKTQEEIAQAISDVLFKFDEYIFAVRKVLIAERKFIDNVPFSTQTLLDQAAALPLFVDGVPAGKTQSQYDGLRHDLAGIGKSLASHERRLAITQGAVVGAAVTFAVGGPLGLVGLGLAAIPTYGSAVAFGYGLGLFSTFGAVNVASRYVESDGNWTASALGGAWDTLGITSLTVSYYGHDPLTGRPVTPEEQGEHVGGLIAGLTMVIHTTYRKLSGGQTVVKEVTTEIPLNDQAQWQKAGNASAETLTQGNQPDAPVIELTEAGAEMRVKNATTVIEETGTEIIVEAAARKPWWILEDGSIWWPDDDGFAGGIHENTTLAVGTKFDRFGDPFGRFVAPEGTPFPNRSLPPENAQFPHLHYEVLQPIEVQKGVTAPWFDQPGGGIQYKLPQTIIELIDAEKIREVGQ